MENLHEENITSVADYKEKKQRQKRRKTLITGGIIICIVFLVILIWKSINEREYHDYSVTAEYKMEEASPVKYKQTEGNILRYGGDDLALINRQGEELWNKPFMMDNPQVDTCRNTGVVYNKKGNLMTVFDVKGIKGEIKTKLPVIKARVSVQGVVAAILEDGETTWINLYDVKGNEIVTSKTRVDSPGYPIDISLSEDGLNLAVTYFCIRAFKPSSYIAFYNFGNIGQNQMDNKVSSYTYTGTLVPSISHMTNEDIVAFRDDGFTLFHGQQIPEEKKKVKVEGDIVSVFHDEKYIGYVLDRQDEKGLYQLELYDVNGEKKWTKDLEIHFEKIGMSDGQIILHNQKQFAIYAMNGICRYKGSISGEGSIVNIFREGKNTYRVIKNDGYVNIKLK